MDEEEMTKDAIFVAHTRNLSGEFDKSIWKDSPGKIRQMRRSLCDIKDLYDEDLDKEYGNIDLCGEDYKTSFILKEIDRFSYDTGLRIFIHKQFTVHKEEDCETYYTRK